MKILWYFLTFTLLCGCMAKYSEDRFKIKHMKGPEVVIEDDKSVSEMHFGPSPSDPVVQEEPKNEEQNNSWWPW